MDGFFGTQNIIGFFVFNRREEFIFNSLDDDAEEAKDEITGALIDGVYIWDRLCL